MNDLRECVGLELYPTGKIRINAFHVSSYQIVSEEHIVITMSNGNEYHVAMSEDNLIRTLDAVVCRDRKTHTGF